MRNIKIAILTCIILSTMIAFYSTKTLGNVHNKLLSNYHISYKHKRYDPLLDYKDPVFTYNIDELNCLALNVYFEARGESSLGQHAVAWVTLNRVNSPLYPKTICDVVYQDNQFSWTNDHKSDKPKDNVSWKKALYIAYVVYKDGIAFNDPTNGSVMYHSIKVKPLWRKAYDQTTKIDDHIFYREKELNG